MGLERRQRGGLYFYRSVRINGRPCKLYLGTERACGTLIKEAEERRRRQQADRDALRVEQRKTARGEAALEEAHSLVELLMTADLLVAGFHLHRGQWRRRRNHATCGTEICNADAPQETTGGQPSPHRRCRTNPTPSNE
jgi:hypothetical protein